MSERADRAFMDMAYGLAAKAAGLTSPNPAVGAVVVRRGVIVGWGYHTRAGCPHAEIVALERAGRRAKGTTLYVTLEPCVHWGKTPPCADAVLAAEPARVVISARDPNPVVHNKGIARLREAGVDVSVGILEERNRRLNESAVKFITRKMPFVTLKAAVSLDGKLAARSLDARWISSAASREYAHLLREDNDAVLIGAGTLITDNPLLTVRHPFRKGKAVTRIILDSKLRFPLFARILSTLDEGPVLIIAGEGASRRKAGLLRRKGAEVVVLPSPQGRPDLRAVLGELARRDIAALLVEGGRDIHTAFLERGLADKMLLVVAPLLLGGRDAPGLFEGRGAPRIADGIRLAEPRFFSIGEDLVVEGYPSCSQASSL